MHQEELGDRVIGLTGGYLMWSGRLPLGPQATAVAERLSGRQLGPQGRELVAQALEVTAERRRPALTCRAHVLDAAG